MTKTDQNKINHVIIELDSSGSMQGLEKAVIEVADQLIRDLAAQSKQFDQETRITIYSFDTVTKCLIWDMDVLRAPSLATLYKVNPNGMTALIDATLTAITEMEQVTQIHGDHSFLLYNVTDGGENRSRNRADVLNRKITSLPDNWTTGALVPDFQGVAHAKAFGFPAGNVMTWNATSARGVEEAGVAVAASTQSFMATRATTGARSTKNLFGGTATVNAATVTAANLKPVDPKTYKLIPVIPSDAVKNAKGNIEIAPYVRSVNKGLYEAGSVYYPVLPALKRNPRIDPQKGVAVFDNDTKMLYSGPGVRKMLGIPEDKTVTVKPDKNPDWTVYVQSTSPNRHLTPHSFILLFN